MKRMMVFLLCISIVVVAHAAPSRNRYAACKQAADTYSGVAVVFSNAADGIIKNTKPRSKEREAQLKTLMDIKEEQEAQEFQKLRQVEALLVQRGEDYLVAGEWRITMETGWIIAFNEGVKNPGKSKIYYQTKIEDICTFGDGSR